MGIGHGPVVRRRWTRPRSGVSRHRHTPSQPPATPPHQRPHQRDTKNASRALTPMCVSTVTPHQGAYVANALLWRSHARVKQAHHFCRTARHTCHGSAAAMVKICTQVVGCHGGGASKQPPGHSPGSPNKSESAGGVPFEGKCVRCACTSVRKPPGLLLLGLRHESPQVITDL